MFKVAHVLSPKAVVPPSGDRGRYLLINNLIQEQIKRGYDITLFANKKSKMPCTVKSIMPLEQQKIQDLQTSQQILKHYSTMLLLSKAYRHAERYDIIHAHLDNAHFFMSPLVKIPTVMTQHWPIEPLTQKIITQVPYSNVYITPISKAQKKHYKELIVYTKTVYNGIDIDRFKFKKQPENHFVFLGRLHPSKGSHIAIKLCRSLKKKLVLAGSTDLEREIYRQYWEKHINPALKSPYISYKGEISHRLVSKFLGQAKALIFPIQWEEPFGLVMVESMACGTPVITFNRGSAPELVKQGVTGFVVNNEDEMREAIKNIDKIDRTKCRQWVKDNFTTSKMADGYEDVYKKIIKKYKK